MDHFLFGITIFLMLLATFNLFVGVSNDAVNFLSSAIGSRTAPYNIVMIVAAAGVLLGCTFSNGMMEIARKGVFNPNLFTYWDIMLIFFAVVMSDVLLLDMFNSMGLPTSTTVSIIFELLGASVISACYKLWVTTDSLGGLAAFINSEKALSIITGILASVAVAFTFGLLVQWLVRLIFSFKYQKAYRWFGAVYSALCITAIFYFLIIKGAKGASFMTPEMVSFLEVHTGAILWSLFACVAILFQILIVLFNFNALRIVILSGTFALAFAFAGNDLVNFVGVPLAALQSTQLAQAAWALDPSLTPQTYMMDGLMQPVKTPTIYLVLSGVIMVLTLWFSPKAKRVVQTAINLSTSERSEKEQFGASSGGRVIVRSALSLKHMANQLIPKSVMNGLGSRFEKPRLPKGEMPLPFDQVRASVNLVLASSLIALATAWKLPLSTTYVTFMVAMGSSLADGAWDRETAVYRISGVMTVISGWFLTGFTAFAMAGIAVLLCIWLGPVFMVAAGIIVVALLIKGNFFHRTKVSEDAKVLITAGLPKEELRKRFNQAIDSNLTQTVDLYNESVSNLLAEDYGALKALKAKSQGLLEHISHLRSQYYLMIVHGEGPQRDYDARNYYYRTFTNMKEVAQSLRNCVSQMEEHLANSHSVFKGSLRANLLRAGQDLTDLQEMLGDYVKEGNVSDELILKFSNQNLEEANRFQFELLKQIEESGMPLHRSELYLSILQLYREIVNHYTVIILLQRELNHILSEKPAPQAG